MARVKNPITVLGQDGRPLAGATVLTRTRPGGDVVQAYAAETGAAPADNPATTDGRGRVTQWVERDAYASTVTADGMDPYVEEWDAAAAADGSVVMPWLDARSATLVGDFSQRPPSADVPGASFYASDKGMTWHSTGAEWVLVAVRALNVTALPASPLDGQEVRLQASTSAAGVFWHLRYRAVSPSPYKWEYVGGACLIDEIYTPERTASATYTDLATVGPRVTSPVAGEFLVTLCGTLIKPTVQAAVLMSMQIGATAAVDQDALVMQDDGSTDLPLGALSRELKRELRAPGAFTAKYRVNGGTGTFIRRSLSIVPVRVG